MIHPVPCCEQAIETPNRFGQWLRTRSKVEQMLLAVVALGVQLLIWRLGLRDMFSWLFS